MKRIRITLVFELLILFLIPSFALPERAIQVRGERPAPVVGTGDHKGAPLKTPRDDSWRRKAVKTFSNSLGMKFVKIPAGSFMLGSPPDESGRDDDETQHRVTISRDFYMQTTEVTQGQWYRVMDTRPWAVKKFVRDNPDHPAMYISWDDCQEFIRRIRQKEKNNTYRLPTEAEWERACRAGSSTSFHFGDMESRLGDYAWYDKNAWYGQEKYAHRVGSKRSSPWGLYDMHGNVWEWCEDIYNKDAYREQQRNDPVYRGKGHYRVFRSGSWYESATQCRSANRNWFEPGVRRDNLGFRLLSETAGRQKKQL